MTHPQLYTIFVFSENKPGVLYRIADLFLRRRINIESLTVSEIEEHKMSRFTITVKADGALVEKIVKQIYRIIEVLKVVECTDHELIFQELAMFKVHIANEEKRKQLNEIVSMSQAKVLHFTKDSITIVLYGIEEQVNELKKVLQPFGLKDFVRSGRIAIAKDEEKVTGKSMKNV
jgi:acetolactate synthase-1/3 small subunit